MSAATHVLWVTNDGTSYSVSVALIQGHNNQYAVVDVGQRDQIWHLAWRP